MRRSAPPSTATDTESREPWRGQRETSRSKRIARLRADSLNKARESRDFKRIAAVTPGSLIQARRPSIPASE